MLEKIKEDYKDELEEIISALSKCTFEELEDDNFEKDIIELFTKNYGRAFEYSYGCTKGVLIFEQFGFVIKIPFIFHYGEEMTGAKDGLEYWNYCSQEENYYDKAKLNGFEEVFLETAFLTKVKDHPIYIQLFAEEIGSDGNHNSSEQDEETTEEIRESYGYDCVNCSWEADLFVNYGKEYYIKLKEYIENNVDDLHSSNIGYFHNRPVILDYAGYDE